MGDYMYDSVQEYYSKMSDQTYTPEDWPTNLDEPVEFALNDNERIELPRIQVSSTPPGPHDGLGTVMPTEEELFGPQSTVIQQEKDSIPVDPRIRPKQFDQHIDNSLNIIDEGRKKNKRVRFDDGGASPRKRAKLATELEEALRNDDSGQLANTTDILKIQMHAIKFQEEEKARLLSLVEALKQEVERLLTLNLAQSERRIWIAREVLSRRAADLKAHSDFLLSLASND